jgi:hypothetical protein
MIANGFGPADIPTIDLKLLQLSLQKRIAADSRLLLEVNVELLLRAPSVVISTTVGDKIPLRAENAE